MENNEVKKNKKTLIGEVVSNKMQKTIVVRVDNFKKHRLYKKYINFSKNFKAHDENQKCKIGDTVKIIECRPLSKDKHFRVVQVIKSAIE